MDTKRHLIRFVATTNFKNRMMGALLSRFRVVDMQPPTNAHWVNRAITILQAEGLNPSHADVTQMLKGFQGSARDLINLLEETVFAAQAVQQAQPQTTSINIGGDVK